MNTYMRGMPRSASSSAMPDLFDHMPSAPAQRPRRMLPQVKSPLPELTSMSDARLARLLKDLTAELTRRKNKGAGRESQPELDQAVQEAARVLDSLVPRQTRRTKQPKGADALSSLHDPKRKAIRAALLAGVAPGQVAKHFGLPLATVRKVLSQGE
jgi:hypothetical protein